MLTGKAGRNGQYPLNTKNPPTAAEGFVLLRNYLLCSQTWLPTVQEVLQADWQEAGHSPQPPVRRVFFSIALLTVWICFLMCITSKSKYYYSYILPCFAPFCKRFLLNTIAIITLAYAKERVIIYRCDHVW